ncbi:MAG: TerC/Alx family metal homeostasis membrane protein [Acidobacteria bacterium]|nr:TerC/Alx family metal homeostasis membrane protein [Acidobacteriota bacterium]
MLQPSTSVGLAPWVVFNSAVIGLLALDVRIAQRNPRPMRPGEAIAWSGFWIGLAAVFAGFLYWWRGPTDSLDFVTGWVIEESLSIDNLFVFLVIFHHFGVPGRLQRRVLSYGFLGALLLRAIFILAGISLIRRFEWITYVFGALLVYSGIQLFRRPEGAQPQNSRLARAAQRWLPMTADFRGARFFVFDREQGRRTATRLFLVLLVIEASDVLFAVDSIPAVLAITRNSFVVYTSNVLAVLGLRALYFALAGLLQSFRLLHYGLAAILAFMGVKMLISSRYVISTPAALAVIVAVLAASIVASALNPAPPD